MKEMINIVVGFDQRESVAYHVFCQSILDTASCPVTFIPLASNFLRQHVGSRRDGSNEFIYTRFLTPFLMGFEGYAIYVDCDMVCKDDILNLWNQRDSSKAVQVVKHDYKTKASIKYLGNKNENYPRKNWSSMILWNCGHEANSVLVPDFLAQKDGAFLHRFQWLSDDLVGEIDDEWNWLADEYPENNGAKLIHYTLGTPCFKDYQNCSMSEYWHNSFERAKQGFD